MDKEAFFNVLKTINLDDETYQEDPLVNALYIAIDRAIAKKVKMSRDSYAPYKCPRCNMMTANDYNFCHNCGQHWDWS